jgi:hypothetical protein
MQSSALTIRPSAPAASRSMQAPAAAGRASLGPADARIGAGPGRLSRAPSTPGHLASQYVAPAHGPTEAEADRVATSRGPGRSSQSIQTGQRHAGTSAASSGTQLVNNHSVVHARTAYTDDPDSPRHLLRLWLSLV